MTIKVFVSYSQEDFKPEARYLCNYLSRHIPDSDIFIDQLKPKGSKWQEENDQKLLDSDVFVVVMTNGAMSSKEVKREIELAKQDDNRRIIPCKDDLLKMNWNQMPLNLNMFDGLEFERKEELGRKLVGEIRSKFDSERIIPEQSGKTKPIRIRGIPNTNIDLDYKITNGEILSAIFDRDSISLIIGLTTFGEGILELLLGRHIIDAKRGDETDQFFVLVNGEEAVFEETLDENSRILKINLQHGTDSIEIIGTEILGTSSVGSAKKDNVIRILSGSSLPDQKKYFDKETLTIKAGDNVQWENNDSVAHTVTSGMPSDADSVGALFDSSLILGGTTFSVTIEKTGEIPYFCILHPWKKGKIVVN